MYGLESKDVVSFWDGQFGVDVAAETRLRGYHLVNPALGDPMAAINQRTQIESDLFEGVEAWDYTNPYIWVSSQWLAVPGIVPDYALQMDTSANVAHNVQSWEKSAILEA